MALSPFGAWLSFIIVATLYHVIKVALSLPFEWESLLTSAYWYGCAMLFVQLGLVERRKR